MTTPFYTFNQYLRQHFNQRVHRISLDAGLGCPNLDGTTSEQGCIFCNNKSFSPATRNVMPLAQQIETAIEQSQQRFKAKKFVAYFHAFSSTHADVRQLEQCYAIIRNYPEIVGLFVSTRPDCIDEEKIRLIASFQQQYLVWIEYGLQTTHDRLLQKINRNHSYNDFLSALELTRKYNISVGVHMILGLPQSQPQDHIIDAQRLAQLDIQGVKLHVLHVVKDTQLQQQYRQGKVTLLTQEQYVSAVCDFLEYIPQQVVVLRLVSSASPQYLVAPQWMNNKQAVIQAIEKEFARRGTKQGDRRLDPPVPST